MLQAFLLQFIPAMVQGVTLAIPLGILLAVFLRLDLPEYKNTLKRALYWGFWLSLFFVVVKVGTRDAITREGFEALTIVIAIVAEVVLLVMLFFKRDLSKKVNKVVDYECFRIGHYVYSFSRNGTLAHAVSNLYRCDREIHDAQFPY